MTKAIKIKSAGTAYADRIDDKMNDWFAEHPDIKVISIAYHKDKYETEEALIVYEEADND